jgi:hypothetical protein
MSLLNFPPEIQRKFPRFCQRVATNRNLPPLPDGYVVDAFYTTLDDLPCESHKEGYIWKVPYTSETRFTVATVFFNKEVVFAWYDGKVYVNRIPKTFTFSFETDLGARYCQAVEDAYEEQAESYEIPVDRWEVTVEQGESFSKLSKQALWQVRNEIKRQRIEEQNERAFEEALEGGYLASLCQARARSRTEAENKRIDALKQHAFDEAMANR